MITQAVEVDRTRLQAGIEALARAGQSFQLSRFERVSFRTLMVSVDVAIVSFVAMLLGIFSAIMANESEFIFVGILSIVFSLAVLVGIIALALNIPLFRRAAREKARLKHLGLDALSKSLWKESRRSRWLSRIRNGFVIVIGVFSVLCAVTGAIMRLFVSEIGLIFIILFYGMLAMLLFAASYLRNQRERIELTASAEKLRAALIGVRERAGEGNSVAVPSDLLAQAARIETAQIAQARKNAILQSVASRPIGYAVSFDPRATDQRAALPIDHRIEFEDLVAEISTSGANIDAQAGRVSRRDGATFRARTLSGHVEVDCEVDDASRSIRVTSVTHVRDDAEPVAQTETGGG